MGSADLPIYTHSLDNGLVLLLEPMPWLPTVSFSLLLPVGALTDPEGAEGSAAVLFDWFQRGAGERDSRAFSETLDGLGVRRGGGAGKESTRFSASLLADALGESLAAFADMVRRPRFDPEEFVGARELAAQELASLDDNPSQRLFETLSTRYFASAHGRSAYGTVAGLAALTAEGLAEDAHRRVGPRGAILAVAGGAEWEPLVERVERAFGGWTGGVVEAPEIRVRPPHQDHLEADTAQVQIGLAYRGVAPDDPRRYHHALAMNVLSGGMGSRLHTEVRERRGLVYSVAAVNRTIRGYGYTLGYAGTTADRADTTLEVMLSEIDRLSQGVTADELERARTGILSQLVMQGESSGARASAMATDMFLRGAVVPLAEVRRQIGAIGLAEVNDYLHGLPAPAPTILTLGPRPLAPVTGGTP